MLVIDGKIATRLQNMTDDSIFYMIFSTITIIFYISVCIRLVLERINKSMHIHLSLTENELPNIFILADVQVTAIWEKLDEIIEQM